MLKKPASSRFDLSGKWALVTGAGGMLGFEHTAALLEVGAKVVMTDVNFESLERTQERLRVNFDSNQWIIYKLDVCDEQEVLQVMSALNSQSVNIDILVNNAAIDPKVGKDSLIQRTNRVEDISISRWHHEINVGMLGSFLMIRHFGGSMARRGGGVILNIASDLSVISPDQRLYKQQGLPSNKQPVKPVTYSIIKTGIIGLTRYIATYWCEQGVRCNALSPGGVINGQDPEFVELISSRIPIGRMANRDEYRSAVQFLCSDASSYMTGQNIVIDGGRSIW